MKLQFSRRSAGKCLSDLLVVAALIPLFFAAFVGVTTEATVKAAFA